MSLKPLRQQPTPRLEFASEEAMSLASDALVSWAEQYPDASEALSQLWAAHLMNVGHKRLGRMLTSIS